MPAFAARAGYDVVAVFKERPSRNYRVERKKVLSRARARQIEVIHVTEFSHWGRSTSRSCMISTGGISVLALIVQSLDLNTAKHPHRASNDVAQQHKSVAYKQRNSADSMIRDALAPISLRGCCGKSPMWAMLPAKVKLPEIVGIVTASKTVAKM